MTTGCVPHYLTYLADTSHFMARGPYSQAFQKVIDPDFKVLYKNIGSAKMYTFHVFSILCLNLQSAIEISSKKRMQRKQVLGRTSLFFRL